MVFIYPQEVCHGVVSKVGRGGGLEKSGDLAYRLLAFRAVDVERDAFHPCRNNIRIVNLIRERENFFTVSKFHL